MTEYNPELSESIKAYFDELAEKFGYPPLHNHFEEERIYSDGIKLNLDVIEVDRKAPTVVFVPGTSLYSMCYAEVLYRLSTHGYNIVGVDPRGHGRSLGRRGDYTIEELITDTENAIHYTQSRFNSDISIMGSSQGGIVSLYMAAKHDYLKSAVCQNFADLSNDKTLKLARHPNLTRYIKPFLNKIGGPLSETQVPVSLYLNLERIKVKHFGNARKFMDSDPLALKTVSLRALRSLTSTPIPKQMEDIKTPIMVFQGSNDSIFPIEYTKELYDRLNCVKRMHVFEGLNHSLMTNDVDQIIGPILDWLDYIHQVSSS